MLIILVELLKNLFTARTERFSDPVAIEKAKEAMYEYMDATVPDLENPVLDASLWAEDAVVKLEALREFRDLAIIRMSPRTVLAHSTITPIQNAKDYLDYWRSILQYKYPYTGEVK